MINGTAVLNGAYLEHSLEHLKLDISAHYLADEPLIIKELLTLATPSTAQLDNISRLATNLITNIRSQPHHDAFDKILQEYNLNNEEGIALMCLAESLLRIPDAETANSLVKDKFSTANWEEHLQHSDSFLVNASTWALMLTGKTIKLSNKFNQTSADLINQLVTEMGEPVIRAALNQAIKLMGNHFILGRNIEEAFHNSKTLRLQGYEFSYDMLGEAALTKNDSDTYYSAYYEAIKTLSENGTSSSISIKLSALHPRYEDLQVERLNKELIPRLITLLGVARQNDISITIDAEEADRLELSLNLFEQLFRHPICLGWGKLGIAVQAYSKRALPILCWLSKLAESQSTLIPVRLVKGAYWDSEIKHSQELGLTGYPVFTLKNNTDISYLACAHFLLSPTTKERLYPQFATHNAQTIADILTFSNERSFEFQRLQGMGSDLYQCVQSLYPNTQCRIYAPIGEHKQLLPYLVRRLLENGANSSFVHKLSDKETSINQLVAHPCLKVKEKKRNRQIPLPTQLFQPERENSTGLNLSISSQREPFISALTPWLKHQWHSSPLISNKQFISRTKITEPKDVYSVYDSSLAIGSVQIANSDCADNALETASKAFDSWSRSPVKTRTEMLLQLANLLETHRTELIALCVLEGGKCLPEAIDEFREAVDFCRYYACNANALLATQQILPSVTGEYNELFLRGRGVFICISPWNFPLAIYIGQITAALVSGNCVIAKPATQTNLIAYRVAQLILEAGVPVDVFQFLPCPSKVVSDSLLHSPKIAGVAFTGSTDTATNINQVIANRNSAAIATLIAETGGQNAMIVDSSALPEQVVKDAISSAFNSAGQRCSALRVLFLQAEIADDIINMLTGAIAELRLGNPSNPDTDIGPVIDRESQKTLQLHIDWLNEHANFIARANLPDHIQNSSFIAPCIYEIQFIEQLSKEHFGPILHVIRYKSEDIQQIINDINDTGFGLTLGIHSRNETFANFIREHAQVGNIYLNRNMIGAVVGSQPFGGQGLSGTGPKAGGPNYLLRFISEQTYSVNSAAIGGNTRLLTQLEN